MECSSLNLKHLDKPVLDWWHNQDTNQSSPVYPQHTHDLLMGQSITQISLKSHLGELREQLLKSLTASENRIVLALYNEWETIAT